MLSPLHSGVFILPLIGCLRRDFIEVAVRFSVLSLRLSTHLWSEACRLSHGISSADWPMKERFSFIGQSTIDILFQKTFCRLVATMELLVVRNVPSDAPLRDATSADDEDVTR